jgi:quercetin dioxygenase-like cupin family protein
MEIQSKTPSIKGPADWFSGDVWIDLVVQQEAPSTLSVIAVHFAPGARTAWHSHGLGQTLYVTEGEGLVQSRGSAIVTIRPGDVIHTAADEWHWHGGAAKHFMTHLSMTQGDVEWGEHVTDTEYSSDER